MKWINRFSLVLGLGLLWLSSLASAQIYSNLDLTTCLGGTCTGWAIDNQNAGGGGGTGTLEEITTAPNGHALRATVSGPGWSNVLFYSPQAASTANYFYSDQIAYTQSLAGVQAVEFDMYAFNAPYRFMFGSQCVMGGNWWGWNDNIQSAQGSGGWIDLHIPCVWSANQWHLIRWWAHRDAASTANCAGFHANHGTAANFPCVHQDVLEVDGQKFNVNLTTPASDLTPGWGNVAGTQFQLDQNSSGQTIQMGVANIHFTVLGQ